VRAACQEIGHDPGGMVFSVTQTVCCGTTDAQVAARAEATRFDLSPNAFRGTPDRVVEQIGRFLEAGACSVHLQILDLTDGDHLDHVELIGSRVLPQLR
jgi:alkanesulfonate monooxygenase SsuD/methylene tetrahydromethanopterin reductase-like flavin-dependent oxidoreductase (luciferase family)